MACSIYSITNQSIFENKTVQYTDCNTNEIITHTLGANTSEIICAVTNSVVTSCLIEDQGDCGNPDPSPTPTPTITPTRTQTPSPTQIICGYGLTTGDYYYTDCCGNFIQGSSTGISVIFNYTKPSLGITRLNSPATTTCVTPTPTKTPTPTPTITQTQTQTPTQTKTPTTTPSATSKPLPSPVYRPKNECDVFTLFDMGLMCNVISIPSSSVSNDGVLTLDVTGGTSPYSFYWANGQRSQTLTGIGPGSYECNVVDYYEDYSSTIVCEVFGPTPTPTPTQTQTPTVTPSGTFPNLCFIATSLNSVYGPWQFTYNGIYNGKYSWIYDKYKIVWNDIRWEIVLYDMTPFIADNNGIFVSTSTLSVPLSDWNSIGGQYAYNITMTTGNCPSKIPLQTEITKNENTCDGVTNCDGAITIGAKHGQPPYSYSINGLNYEEKSTYNGLCKGTYTLYTKDFNDSVVMDVVDLNGSKTPITYNLFFDLIDRPDPNYDKNNQNNIRDIVKYTIKSNEEIKEPIKITVDLEFDLIKTINGPGTGRIIDSLRIFVDGTEILPIDGPSKVIEQDRPDCSSPGNPIEQIITTNTQYYKITLSSTSTISIIGDSYLIITKEGVIGINNCNTKLENKIIGRITNSMIEGCTCCGVTGYDSAELIDTSLDYVEI